MAVLLLDSLVLRGVSVLSDGKTVGLRLGFGSAAVSQAPGIASVPHPLPGRQDFYPPADNPDRVATSHVDGAMSGAGRSRRRAGSPSCRSWASNARGPKQAAAANWFPKRTGFVASVREGTPLHAATAPSTVLSARVYEPQVRYAGKRAVESAGRLTAGRTSASTWGMGVR